MEYAEGGDLLSQIKEYKKRKEYIPETFAWKYLSCLLNGLNTLHKFKILHRDIKSANIFLTINGVEAKLGDLNVSKVLK